MSQNRKLLKVFSLIQVLVAVFALVLGFVTIGSSDAAAGTAIDVFGMQLEGGMWTTLCGGLSIATGVLTFISAALGIRGANRPSSLGGHAPASILAAVAGIASAILAVSGGLLTWIVTAAAAILAILAAIFDARVRKELDR